MLIYLVTYYFFPEKIVTSVANHPKSTWLRIIQVFFFLMAPCYRFLLWIPRFLLPISKPCEKQSRLVLFSRPLTFAHMMKLYDTKYVCFLFGSAHSFHSLRSVTDVYISLVELLSSMLGCTDLPRHWVFPKTLVILVISVLVAIILEKPPLSYFHYFFFLWHVLTSLDKILK